MTSVRLRRHVERELARLHGSGRRNFQELVGRFLALDHGGDFPRLDRYVESCRSLARRAREEGADELALVLRYFVGRTFAYPLDRPSDALSPLVELLADVATPKRRGTSRECVQPLVELEILRAWHKIDAPGYRAEIVAGARELWPRLGDDLGPQTELLDVSWRTAYWCRDVELMRAATRLAHDATRALRFSAGYWLARERSLEGCHDEAAELLAGLLSAREELEESGEAWRHYLGVELAVQEAALGRGDAAEQRLERIVAEAGALRDPMLRWDLERARALSARARSDDAAEVAAWSAALEAVAGLGTDRLECEFAVELARAAVRANHAAARRGDAAALVRARAILDTKLPSLRSGAELAAEARAIPGLYSAAS